MGREWSWDFGWEEKRTKSLLGGWAPCSQGLWRTVGCTQSFAPGVTEGGHLSSSSQPRGGVAPLVPSPPHSSLGPTSASPLGRGQASRQGSSLYVVAEQSASPEDNRLQAVAGGKGRAPTEGWEPGHSRCTQVCFQTGSRSL